MTNKEELINALEVLGNHCDKQNDCAGCYLYMFCSRMNMYFTVSGAVISWKFDRVKNA